jgi:hypothetical protein
MERKRIDKPDLKIGAVVVVDAKAFAMYADLKG